MSDKVSSVLDASALLAYLQDESGAEVVEEALARGSAMSAANWAEVLSKLAEAGQKPETVAKFFPTLAKLDHSLSHRHCQADRFTCRVLAWQWVVEQHHDSIAHSVVDTSSVGVNQLAHFLVIGLQDLHGFLGFDSATESCEAAQVAKQRNDVTAVAGQRAFITGLGDQIDHLG